MAPRRAPAAPEPRSGGFAWSPWVCPWAGAGLQLIPALSVGFGGRVRMRVCKGTLCGCHQRGSVRDMSPARGPPTLGACHWATPGAQGTSRPRLPSYCAAGGGVFHAPPSSSPSVPPLCAPLPAARSGAAAADRGSPDSFLPGLPTPVLVSQHTHLGGAWEPTPPRAPASAWPHAPRQSPVATATDVSLPRSLRSLLNQGSRLIACRELWHPPGWAPPQASRVESRAGQAVSGNRGLALGPPHRGLDQPPHS